MAHLMCWWSLGSTAFNSAVKTPCYDVNSLSKPALLTANGTVQMSRSWASISIRRYVNSCGRYLGLFNSHVPKWLAVILVLEHQLLSCSYQSPWSSHASVLCGLLAQYLCPKWVNEDIALWLTKCKWSWVSCLLQSAASTHPDYWWWEILRNSGFFDCLRHLTSTLALQPCFCFLSLSHLHILPAGMMIHGETGVKAVSAGILWEWRKSAVT